MLPLSPCVQLDVLGSTCPLMRMHTVVDALRLLLEPGPRRWRGEHRFRLRSAADGTLLVTKREGDAFEAVAA